jgi:hypothetical protein
VRERLFFPYIAFTFSPGQLRGRASDPRERAIIASAKSPASGRLGRGRFLSLGLLGPGGRGEYGGFRERGGVSGELICKLGETFPAVLVMAPRP